MAPETSCGCDEKRPHLHGDFTKRDGTKGETYVLPPCRLCDAVARFSVTAVGYSCPMARACADHLGAVLEADASHGGSTLMWEVRRG